MGVSYKRLWKILIDRDMKKKDLMNAAGLSPSTISKLSGNEFVSMQVIVKISPLKMLCERKNEQWLKAESPLISDLRNKYGTLPVFFVEIWMLPSIKILSSG